MRSRAVMRGADGGPGGVAAVAAVASGLTWLRPCCAAPQRLSSVPDCGIFCLLPWCWHHKAHTESIRDNLQLDDAAWVVAWSFAT